MHGRRVDVRGHRGEVYGVAFSTDGRVLASAAEDGLIKLWDPATGQELRTIAAHGNCGNDLSFSPDGRLLASASCDHTVKIWDTATWREVSSFACGPHSVMTCVEFSPDGSLLAAGDDDSGAFTIWDVAQKEQIVRIVADGSESASGLDAISWSPDGRLLATTQTGNGSSLWDARSWTRIENWYSRSRPIAFSPNARMVITHSEVDGGN